MKKTLKIFAMMLVLAMVLCSCQGKKTGYSDGLTDKGYFEGVKASELFEVGDLTKIEIKQSDIDDEIEFLTHDIFPKETKVFDRVITKEDDVNIDYTGYIDGVEFENGSTKGNGTTVDIDQDSYIDNFLEQLIGHKPGETFDINVTFPADYQPNKDLSGKAAKFVTKVNYISDKTPVEFTDDFIKENQTQLYYGYGRVFKTTEDFIDFMKDSLIDSYVVENCKFKEGAEVPASVEAWVKNFISLDLKATAENQYGVELITYLKNNYSVSSLDEFFEKNKSTVTTQCKNYLLVQALSETLGIVATDEEVKTSVSATLEKAEDYDEILKYYGLPYLKQYATQTMIFQHFNDIAVVK